MDNIPLIVLLVVLWFIKELINTRVSRKDMYAYYRTPTWKHKREEAFKIHGKKCAVCDSNENLQVHHLRYRKWLKLPMIFRRAIHPY